MSAIETISLNDETAKIYQFGSFRLEAESRRLWQDNRSVKLTAKNFDVLLFLVGRHGKVVERDELLRNVWRENFVEDGNLTVHIGVLRKLLGDTQSEARFIATRFAARFLTMLSDSKRRLSFKGIPRKNSSDCGKPNGVSVLTFAGLCSSRKAKAGGKRKSPDILRR